MLKKYIIVCLAVFLTASCDKEDRKNVYANQESMIENYVSTLGTEYTVVLNGGVCRVVVSEGPAGANTLSKGDSLYFHYSGYVFNYGKGSLFYTNDPAVAESSGFETDGKPMGIKYGSSSLLKGLDLGLDGVKEGERCNIIFSARYGYGNQTIANIPRLTPLFFDIKIDRIVK